MITITGTVEHGDALGRKLGFPTANIPLGDDSIGDGVWVGGTRWNGGEWILAAVSIGRRRTFYDADGPRLLEAHLIDFSDDLYGVELEVRLVEWIRPQIEFSTTEALVDRIHQDVRFVRGCRAAVKLEVGRLNTPSRATKRTEALGTAVPAWALQRVTSAVHDAGGLSGRKRDLKDLAQRVGLSKSLVRQCLSLLEH